MNRLIILLLLLLILFGCNQHADKTRPASTNKGRGLFPIKEYGRWGYIDTTGKTVIKCRFDGATMFSDGLAVVLIDSLYGFIDAAGKVVIEPKYTSASPFSDGMAYVAMKVDTGTQHAFIHTDGSIAFTTNYEQVESFNNGLAAVLINKEICFIDKTGKVVINSHYPYGIGVAFHEGIATVWGDSMKYIDTSGRTIATFLNYGDNFSEGLARVSIDYKSFYIDQNGKKIITPKSPDDSYHSFSDGLALVYPEMDKVGPSYFIDKKGNIAFSTASKMVYDFSNGLAAFQAYDERWGFLDTKGAVAIPPQFEDVSYNGFVDGLCRAKLNHQWGYIDHSGKFVWKEQPATVYEDPDLSKWKLDSFHTDKPIPAMRYAGDDNVSRKGNFGSLNSFMLLVDTTATMVFNDHYYGYKLKLINPTKNSIDLRGLSGMIDLVQQAKDPSGEWKDIDIYSSSFCGNAYNKVSVGAGEYKVFAVPVYKGTMRTQLRFKLEHGNSPVYSNVYNGQINSGQFVE